MENLVVAILAAGQGKRMRSQRGKVLHQIAGKSLLRHVVDTAIALQPKQIYVVYGEHNEIEVKHELADAAVNFVLQVKPLGTGHAVQQVLPECLSHQTLLVLFADTPLITVDTLRSLVATSGNAALTLLTCHTENPAGLGRILRDDADKVVAVVEEVDATPIQQTIKEVFSGILIAPVNLLQNWLISLSNDNQQQEYYLTEIVQHAVSAGSSVVANKLNDSIEISGVNDRLQLAIAERTYQHRLINQLMRDGVTVRDPNRLDVRGNVAIAPDVEIDIDVILVGDVDIATGCQIGPYCFLKNVTLAENVTIHSHCVLEDTTIAAGSVIGPFARLRPGTMIGQQARVGNFVEIKQSVIGDYSKINHLSYIGDSQLGESVNIGAGAITCNYDGENKYQTEIADHVFIGSGTQLIAPISVGEHAFIGAGSTLSRDVPAGALHLTRAPLREISNWKIKKAKESV